MLGPTMCQPIPATTDVIRPPRTYFSGHSHSQTAPSGCQLPFHTRKVIRHAIPKGNIRTETVSNRKYRPGYSASMSKWSARGQTKPERHFPIEHLFAARCQG